MKYTTKSYEKCTCIKCGSEFSRQSTQAGKYCSASCYQKRRDPEIDIWNKVEIRGPNECWPWTGWRDRDGYGNYRVGREQRAHRIIWSQENGKPIPDDLLVCHSCDNPPCCNPKHLFLGTAAINNADKVSKGRQLGPRGELSGNSKLTERDVRQIRGFHSAGVTQRKIATMFGVGYKAICKIVNRQRWKHI